MPNQTRVRQNFLGAGGISDNPLTAAATTINSTGFAPMRVIGTAHYMSLTLDPDGVSGAPEIVHVTAHASSAESITVLRGREGTTARQHPQGTVWRHAPTAFDFPEQLRDYRWRIPTTNNTVSIDEFDDDVIDPSWTLVKAANSTTTWLEEGGVLSALQGTDTAGVLNCMMTPLATPLAVGDAIQTCVTLFGQWAVNYVMSGIVLSDGITHGTGQQVHTLNYTSSNHMNNDTRTSTNFTSGGSSGAYLTPSFAKTHVRLVMTATNTWRCDSSPDGVQWITGTAYNRTLTPTHVGLLATSWGTTTKGVVSYEYLRRRTV